MRVRRLLLLGACALLLAAVGPGSAAAAEPVTLTGVVAPAEEDDEGNALSVQLETPEGTYRVRETGKGAELRQQLGLTVTVRGRVEIDAAGQRQIEVLEYRLVEE